MRYLLIALFLVGCGNAETPGTNDCSEVEHDLAQVVRDLANVAALRPDLMDEARALRVELDECLNTD
jgi:hypothetical protein